jgi:hypothetical protein
MRPRAADPIKWKGTTLPLISSQMRDKVKGSGKFAITSTVNRPRRIYCSAGLLMPMKSSLFFATLLLLIIPRQLQGIIPEDLRLVGEGAGLPNTPGEDAEQEAKHRTKEAAQEASPWVDRLARFGYATKGLVYVVVGALALGVATGVGGRTTDLPGALQEIGAQPFGRVMLGFVAVGLAAYALWRLFQAVADPEGEGRDARGAAARTGHVAAWLGYSGLAFTAGQLVVTSS